MKFFITLSDQSEAFTKTHYVEVRSETVRPFGKTTYDLYVAACDQTRIASGTNLGSVVASAVHFLEQV